MNDHSIIYSLFLIFTGTAVLATVALFARQALLVAYIALGLVIGPFGLNLISDPDTISEIANIGIIFLLFLLGLNLEPTDLGKLFREAIFVTGISAFGAAFFGYVVAIGFGFEGSDALIIAVSMMFSSTIVALKLLPTTTLHHQRMGRLIVSILLLQDILAIATLLIIESLGSPKSQLIDSIMLLLGFPLLSLLSWAMSKHILLPLCTRFEQIPEYLFLLSIGWCMGVAEAATWFGLSHEVGAFIAGVALATNPIARYIAESLKPLRDFFLVLFFFALGAKFNVGELPNTIVPASVLVIFAVLIKPIIFRLLLRQQSESAQLATESGARLGQNSEFSLLIVQVGISLSVLSGRAAVLIQSTAILSFILSSYLIVRRYPTPIATNKSLRRD